VDHYQRDIHFEAACRGWARQILVLDDATGRQHDCDFLVDAAASDCSIYAGGIPAKARLLLGPAYALVRHAFVAKRAEALRRRDGRPVGKILISFGATDPLNVTPIALDALGSIADEISINVALSSRAPHLDEVRRQLRGRIQLILDADMAELMTEADLAIGAAGASAFERAALGLPSIIVTLADNQLGIAKAMVEAGAVIDAGPFDGSLVVKLGPILRTLIADPVARVRVTEAAAMLIDGRGQQRLLARLLDEVRIRDGSIVRLRLAEKSDGDWLLQLQHMPQIRRYFKNPAVPSVDEHASWVTRTLADPDVFFLLIEVEGVRAGYIRLDPIKRKHATIGISIALCPSFQGRGVASVALSLARRLQPSAIFDAEVSPENMASKALFTRAGFRQVNESRYQQRVSC